MTGRRLVLAVLAALPLLVFVRAGPAGDADQEPHSTFSREQAAAFDEFPLYDAGEEVEGFPLVAVLRRTGRADFVSFVYGDCRASDDRGCAPPVEIQVWPACRRNLGLYESSAPGTPAPERTVIRGVPAAFLDRGTRLELQTGRATVVVFGGSRDRVLRVAAELRRAGEAAAQGPLPEPALGALEGSVRC